MPLTRRQIYRRRRTVVFGGLFAVLAGIAYLPLTLLAPVVEHDAVDHTPTIAPAAAAAPYWPGYGASAIAATGFPGLLGQAGSTEALPMASITKIVTALTVLEAHPLAVGDEGPEVTMGAADVALYRHFISINGSVAPISSGLRFTQHELLEIALIDSANNYAASLANWAFGSPDAFLAAARGWLDAHGLTGVTVVEPSGIDPANRATAADLITLGQLALANPVVAQIVGTSRMEMHDLGTLSNTNKLIGDSGVDGIKTGTLNSFGANLLFSADLAVGEQTVQLVGVVLGATDHPSLNADVRQMIAQAQAGFHEVPLVAKGEVLGDYTTPWGDSASAIAADTASVVVWGDTPVTAAVTTEPLRLADKGATVGSVVYTAGAQTVTVPLVLSRTIDDPGPGWRLGHPAIIFGMQ
ncbi:D-alanyl-D-alanine carboxypeptidase family protein [Protaetiibacter larvae]|uniref:D-alanyl-D-alanine carboxypeptidase n=1 Tax=Protaetiibacter larvae TaxID=2592654 RepID=A0A5C1Y7H7_9MICO|nr:D-alanyl-D-alanine carboxypeptidase [Protaetiibacter larvae]QEO10043.1 D-alanyl-D-alanine carboxypeptidase [Protaetiibacter larvae]